MLNEVDGRLVTWKERAVDYFEFVFLLQATKQQLHRRTNIHHERNESETLRLSSGSVFNSDVL